MRGGVQIREARVEDGPAIEAVTLRAYEQYAASMADHWEPYRRNILTTLGTVHPAAQIVAEGTGGIVGTVLLYPAGVVLGNPQGAHITLASPEVRLLAVAPAARGRGVGEALMQECMRRARQSGAPELTLHTTDMMQAAMRLYDRMGFRRAPELDFHPAPGFTVKGFRLSLGPA